jgi:hypothetical protein
MNVKEHANVDGRIHLYLDPENVWRGYWPVDAQAIVDNGDGALDGPEGAPIESTPRVDAHLENLARAQRRRGRV